MLPLGSEEENIVAGLPRGALVEETKGEITKREARLEWLEEGLEEGGAGAEAKCQDTRIAIGLNATGQGSLCSAPPKSNAVAVIAV